MTSDDTNFGAKFTRDGTECAARFAADLEIFSPRQGSEAFSKMPLEIEVSFGSQEFSDSSGFGFVLRFKRVIVEVYLDNAEISRDNRYNRSIPKEAFSHLLETIAEKAQNGSIDAEAGASASLGAILEHLGISIGASARWSKEKTSRTVDTIVKELDVKIVRYVGAGRWEVGHERFGDPLSIDGFLHGAYFYQSSDEQSADEENPLCYISPTSRRPYSGFVELRARKTDCRYFPVGEAATPPRSIQDKNRNAAERILLLRMLEEANRREGLEPPDGEIILARSRFSVKKTRSRN